MNNYGERFDKSAFSKRALKWSISIVLPSLILFGSNQILVAWNLSNLLTAVEKSESSMKAYTSAATVNKPGPGVEAKYWGEHGFFRIVRGGNYKPGVAYWAVPDIPKF